MKKDTENPKLKIKLTAFDYLIEAAALLCWLALFLLPLIYYSDLPDNIPRHFDFEGRADAWDGKQIIFTLPAIGTALYLLLSIVSRFPHKFNYLKSITAENAARQYAIALRIVRMLKFIIMAAFVYIMMGTINTALGKLDGLGAGFLPFLLLVISALMIYGIMKSRQAG